MRVRTPIGRGFIALLLAAGSVLATAQPASAASVTGTAQLNGVAASITRGATDAAQVVVSATESAIFDLDVTGPGVTVTFGAICTLSPGYSGGSPASKCSVTAAGVVTIGNDGDATPNETQTATVDITVAATATATSFTSTEGSNVGGQAVTITASGTATSPTTGTLTNSTANTTINPDAANEAEIRVTTAAPSPTTVERGPLAQTTYSATFARFGKTNQITAVDVQLLSGAAQGTTVSNPTVSNDASPDACTFVAAGSNCAKITFPSGGSPITVTFKVNVPATADVGSTSYAFKGTYDPTGTDGSPLDVENGNSTSFTVLTDTAPNTTIDSGPGGTADQTAVFAFSSDEGGATFECELTGPGQSSGFTTCASPKTYSSLADGEYTFSVRAKDSIGNADPSPATNTFIVDNTAPTTTIDSGPGSRNDGTADYTFSSDETGSTFECELTGPGQSAGFSTCASPQEYTGLADGEYTFSVKATDTAGNTGTADTDTFTMDGTAPTTTIDSGPGSRNDGTADYTFSSDETGSTFECELTGPGQSSGFSTCESPQEYTGLADGEYTFSVKATDTAGNTGTADTDTFTMDGTAPTTTIDSGPGSRNDGTADYTFSSDETGSTFECELTGPGQSSGFSTCESPQEYTGLADGEYTFSVKATDTAGNTGTADTDTFTMDGTAPTTTIDSGPGSRNDGTAEYTFSSSEPTDATFECKLDGPGIFVTGTFEACDTGSKTYPGLADGEYTFSVKATDTAGNTGTADTDTFTMDGTAPTTTIDSGPGSRNDGTADYTFSSDETGSTFECTLDGPGATTGTPEACDSGSKTYTGLADGEYTFSVKATDTAGNTGTADTDTFTMDGTAPTTTIDSGPGSRNDGTADYTFSSDETGSTFECTLDGPGATTGTPEACDSGSKTYTGLADGEYTFSVKATDTAGNTGTADTDTFTMDGTAPTTTIDSGPGSTSDGSADYTFSSDEAGSTFECELTGPGQSSGFSTCESPKGYTLLGDGEYTFSVKATDTIGNTGTADTDTFTVDGTAPETLIDSGPGNTDDGIADFTFSASEMGSTFECKLDGPGATTGTFAACNTGSKSYSGLTDGDYTFSVQATDASNNNDETAATQAFTVVVVTPPTSTCAGFGVTIEGTDASETVQGTPGDDVIAAKAGNDIVVGQGGNDIICGGTGNDQIYGGDGNDGLAGEAGNDTLTGGTGADDLSGGDGTSDRASYYDKTWAVNATIGNSARDDGNGSDGPAGDRDRVYGTVEGLVGGPGNDFLGGSAVANTLDGVSGNDTVNGLGGNDTLLGSGGNDKVLGGNGNDKVYGGTGADSLYGEANNDFLHAKDGVRDTRIDGGTGTDTKYSDTIDPAPISVP